MQRHTRIGLLAVSACLSLASAAHAETNDADSSASKHLGSTEQRQAATQWNAQHSVAAPRTWSVIRPFSEVEATGFVAITGDSEFELPDLRLAMAKNLPAGVTMIVYVGDESEISDLKAEYSQYLGDRLKFVVVPDTGDPDWARDSLPFPVYTAMGSGTTPPTFGLVASIYPQDFDPNAAVDKALGLPMVRTNQYFRGGNLLFDEAGNCFAENTNEVANLSDPQSFFTSYFGCATVTLLDQEGGIGDIDERIKFLTGKDVLTDNDNYAALLQGKGYTVHKIPEVGVDGETYMNTLLVNGTIFVPQMGVDRDQDALKAYSDLGFTAVGVYTKQLADDGEGNIHCVTMNYPAGTFVDSTGRKDLVEFRQ